MGISRFFLKEMTWNPFWDLLVELLGYEPKHDIDPCLRIDDERLDGLTIREFFLSRYAHTIPDPKTVAFLFRWIRRISGRGVISIGAGTGYYEALLSQGCTVFAFDLYPPNEQPNVYHGAFDAAGYWQPTKVFHAVKRGGPEKAAMNSTLGLFLAWPPPGPLAFDALQAYDGNYLFYMGDIADPDQNASQAFFDALDAGWTPIAHRVPTRWKGSHDTIYVFKRLAKASERTPWKIRFGMKSSKN